MILGLDARAARISWTVILIAGILVTLYLVRRTLLIFVLAILLAYLIAPLVNLVDRLCGPRVPRIVALAGVYIAIIATLSILVSTVGGRIGEEAGNLALKFPEYLKNPRLPIPDWLESQRDSVTKWVTEEIVRQTEEIGPMLQHASGEVLAVAGNLVFVVIVPILSFFFLKDAGALRELMLEQVTAAPRRALLEQILDDVHGLLVVYVRALVLLSIATFVSYGIFLGAIGAPYPAILALVAAVFEFIPAAGPLLASVTILLVTGFAGFQHLGWIVVFLIVYRLAQDYGLQPLLFSAGVELPPLAIVFGVLAGEQMAGIPGMFLSVPVLAILRVILVQYRRHRLEPTT